MCLSYAEKILECYDWVSGDWSVLTEKPDWVFGAEMVHCDGRLFTLGKQCYIRSDVHPCIVGGVSSRQVDVYSPESDTWTDGSYPSLKKQRLSHGVCVGSSDHGGVIYCVGGSAEVGGAGHRDLEQCEPGAPSECDCSLCGPTDHINWSIESNKMTIPRWV